MHLGEPEIAALAHGELRDGSGGRNIAELRLHVSTCSECARLVTRAADRDARAQLLLRELDVPVPAVSAADIAWRAGAGAARLRPATGARRRRVIITGALTFLGAAAAAALPSSPLHRIIARAIGPALAVRHPAGPLRTASDPTGRTVAAGAAPAGVSIRPARTLTIAFAAVQHHGVLRIAIQDTPVATVLASGAGVRGYTVAPDRIDVQNAGASADYDLTIPSGVTDARVTVAGSVVFMRHDGAVSTAGQGTDNRYAVPLSNDNPRGNSR